MGIQIGDNVGIGSTARGMRKVARQLCWGISGELTGCYRLGLALTLVTAEEEKFVVAIETWQDNRATGSYAELIPLENIARKAILIIKETVGIESVVAYVIVASHVQPIGTGLGYNADNAAAITSILGRVVVFQNLEFLDSVGIRIEYDTIAEQVVVDAAIEKKRHRI